MAKIESGGQLQSMREQKKIESVDFYSDNALVVSMRINDSSLSYLTIEEAVKLRNELNTAIKQATGV